MASGISSIGKGVVKAFGEIDISNAQELGDAMEASLASCETGLIVDLSPVSYIDSAGLQVILSIYQKLFMSGGRLAIVLGNENVKIIFTLIHPEKLPCFFVTEDLASAEEAVFGAARPC